MPILRPEVVREGPRIVINERADVRSSKQDTSPLYRSLNIASRDKYAVILKSPEKKESDLDDIARFPSVEKPAGGAWRYAGISRGSSSVGPLQAGFKDTRGKQKKHGLQHCCLQQIEE